MIEIVDYKPEHLEVLRPLLKDCHTGEIPKTVCTHAVTLLNKGSPVAILGMFIFVPGVMHVWALVSEEVKNTPVSFFKACIRLRDLYEKKAKQRRMQIDIKDGYFDLNKWAEAVGFCREGLMKSYGPDGSGYWLYGRSNPWVQ